MLPTRFLNVNALFDYRIDAEAVPRALPPALAALESSTSASIRIPSTVWNRYAAFRPTPLFRAVGFERAVGASGEIWIKDESQSPTGNHKSNSAYVIAALCEGDGVRRITTETTGNWGIALAEAAAAFGLRSTSYIDAISHRERPQSVRDVRSHGGDVVVVPATSDDVLLELSADAALDATASMPDAAYIFGSVYGYFVVPQSIIGIEARAQLDAQGRSADVIVGSCGGGANLLGLAATWLFDARRPRIVSAESELCPILSAGRFGMHGVDRHGRFPRLYTYALPHMRGGEYIGGLGSTVVAAAAAHFHDSGAIEAQPISGTAARQAARAFRESQGRTVALESAFQLAAIAMFARERSGVLLTTIASGERDVAFHAAQLEEAS